MRGTWRPLPWTPSQKHNGGRTCTADSQSRRGLRLRARTSSTCLIRARTISQLIYTGRHEDEGTMTEIADTFDSAFTKAVDLGNRLADKDKDADLWDIADGLLAGALQYWLYSRQPCGDPRCQDCMPISTAEGRMAELETADGATRGGKRVFPYADRRERRSGVGPQAAVVAILLPATSCRACSNRLNPSFNSASGIVRGARKRMTFA